MIGTSPTELAGIHKFLQPFAPLQPQERFIRFSAHSSIELESETFVDDASSLRSFENLDAVSCQVIAE